MSFFKNILAPLLRRLNLLQPEAVRYNDLKVYTMVNSITLSTDMNTLYLIDDGRALPFPLQKDKMVLVGLLKGQVTVATSLAPDEMADLPEGVSEGSTSGALLRGGGQEVKAPVNPKSQWTVFFNNNQQIMALIGAVEIDPGLAPENPETTKPSIFLFDLSEVVVGIRRIGNALLVTPLRKEKGGVR
ncbi:MAG: hypothetical protein J5I94_21485 [Phaeodactylibacter sp.]|nr:hypothetical protein [Phaeodactylibacter sp.]